MKKLKGRIVDVLKASGGYKIVVTGIKKDGQPFYDQNLWGSNGSYLASDTTFPVLNVKVSVYDYDNKAISIDIREIVVNYYDWSRITEGRVSELKNRLVGKKVVIIESDEGYSIDNIESLL